MLSSLPVAAQAQYSYTTDGGAVTITGYAGPGGAVTIPDSIGGLPVTGIGSRAFAYSTNLTSVTIPDSVTSIGVEAFTDCAKLASVTMGGNVASIGDRAFYSCTKLTNATIPGSVTTIGNAAFSSCTLLTSITIPSSVTTVGSSAFAWCSSLVSVTVPGSVTNIGVSAFVGCGKLTAITVDSHNPNYASLAGVLFDKSQATLIQCPGAKSGTYAVPNGVTRIGASAFYSCSSLTAVTIPGSVTSIEDKALSHCDHLTAITVDALNPSYSSLNASLYNKTQTTLIQCPGGQAGSYTIPRSVNTIADSAFIGCKSISLFIVDPLNADFSSLGGVLFNKTQTTLVRYPAARAGAYAIPDTVNTILHPGFAYSAGLSSITIPASVTNIGEYVFYACTGLTNLTLPDSVSSIPSGLCQNCTGLREIAFGSGVTSIGSGAFRGCTDLTKLEIAGSITNIMTRAFDGCNKLVSVTLGSSVSNIADAAFLNCTQLRAACFRGDAPAAAAVVFSTEQPAMVYYTPGTTGWGETFGGLPTAPWVPRIVTDDGNFGVRGDQFGFNIAWWDANLPVVVEACPDLSAPVWSSLATNVFVDGLSSFSDPQWTDYPVRFYRVRMP